MVTPVANVTFSGPDCDNPRPGEDSEEIPVYHTLQPVSMVPDHEVISTSDSLDDATNDIMNAEMVVLEVNENETEMKNNLIQFNPNLRIKGTVDGIQFEMKPLISGQEDLLPVLSQDVENLPVKPPTTKGTKRKIATGSKLFKARSKRFKCDEMNLLCEWAECDTIIGNLDVFLDHVSLHSEEAEVDTELESFICLWRECDYESQDSKAMVRHINFHAFHTKIKREGELVLQETGIKPCMLGELNQRNLVPDLSEPMICFWQDCSLCGVESEHFLKPQDYYMHVVGHAEEHRGLFCSKVKKKKKNKRRSKKGADVDLEEEVDEDMGNDKEVDLGLPCKWQDCKGKFGAVSKLKDHLRTHSQERLVGCPICGGLFASRPKFFQHCARQMEFSSEHDKEFECDYCRKRFLCELLLREHMRSHINHYKCPDCDMTCPTPSNLECHMLYRHSDEKPFKCDDCDYAAKKERDLRAHYGRMHESAPIQCSDPNCDFKCTTKYTLDKHFQKVHSGQKLDRKYNCHICQKKFMKGNYLTRHLKQAHAFQWPSGHSRFRYKLGQDGLYHVLTVRFETVEEVNEEEN